MWRIEENWRKSLKERWSELLVIAAIGISICIGIYQRHEEASLQTKFMETQSDCIRKLTRNQAIIMKRLGYMSGKELEGFLKKVDLDSAGN